MCNDHIGDHRSGRRRILHADCERWELGIPRLSRPLCGNDASDLRIATNTTRYWLKLDVLAGRTKYIIDSSLLVHYHSSVWCVHTILCYQSKWYIVIDWYSSTVLNCWQQKKSFKTTRRWSSRSAPWLSQSLASFDSCTSSSLAPRSRLYCCSKSGFVVQVLTYRLVWTKTQQAVYFVDYHVAEEILVELPSFTYAIAFSLVAIAFFYTALGIRRQKTDLRFVIKQKLSNCHY